MATISVRDRVTEQEWAQRLDLAAAYQAAAMLKMSDHIYTHFSARVPSVDNEFLINPYGMMFDEITASNLVKVNAAGEVLLDASGLGINPAGFIIHSAVHEARHDAICVMHIHTAAGIGVSAQRDGLLMISQHAMRFHNRIGYHEYVGVVLEAFERPLLLRSLGSHNALVLRNHGLLVCGNSVADAFDNLYYLERACLVQIAAQAGGGPLVHASAEVAERVALQFEREERPSRYKHWPPLLRMVERAHPECFT